MATSTTRGYVGRFNRVHITKDQITEAPAMGFILMTTLQRVYDREQPGMLAVTRIFVDFNFASYDSAQGGKRAADRHFKFV
ncbi:MAG TPA: hypothetical protein VFB79_21460 [Candidatus Angelobacter sp.]|nr:hypothetical protein [Candidatus Angelobacter sp.]